MKNKTIISVKNKIITDSIILNILSKNNSKTLGLDMKNVYEVKSKVFLEKLLLDEFKLFNLKDEVMAYLSLVLKDGHLKSFMNEDDFLNNKRELIRRKFVAI